MAKSKIKILNSKEGYDLVAKKYDEKEKYLASFEQGRVASFIKKCGGKCVLDVGAGTGRLALSLAEQGAAVSALDISYEMLEVLKRKINGKFSVDLVVADAEALPFSENSFDVVVATFLIVHLKDPFIFFDEVYRVLKPGGLFLLTNINQKEPPHIESNEGLIKITSYYHRPEKIINHLEALAFSIRENAFLKEGEVWINQFIIAEK